MAVTLADLLADCQDFLYSHTGRDQVTSLNGGLTNSAVSITVDDGSVVSQGLIEIDSELIEVQSVASNTLTVYPWGRGQRGTTAAAHSDNAKVTVNPRFPRRQLVQEINNAIKSLYPQLYWVATDTTNTISGSVLTYDLPATTKGVLSASWNAIGPSGLDARITAYRYDPDNQTITIGQGEVGRTLSVVYFKEFGELSVDADTLSSIGVKDDWRDIIKLLACSNLLLALDSEKLQSTSVEAHYRTENFQVGTAIQVARSMRNQAKERITEERVALLQEHKQYAVKARF